MLSSSKHENLRAAVSRIISNSAIQVAYGGCIRVLQSFATNAYVVPPSAAPRYRKKPAWKRGKLPVRSAECCKNVDRDIGSPTSELTNSCNRAEARHDNSRRIHLTGPEVRDRLPFLKPQAPGLKPPTRGDGGSALRLTTPYMQCSLAKALQSAKQLLGL